MHNYRYDIAVVNAPPQLGLHVLPMGVSLRTDWQRHHYSGLGRSGVVCALLGVSNRSVENEARDFCKTLRQYFIGVGSHGVNQQL